MLTHWIISIVIALGFIGFIVGIASPQIVVWNDVGSDAEPGTFGYFGGCSDKAFRCNSYTDYTKDFYHCSSGDTDYRYQPIFQLVFISFEGGRIGVDKVLCTRVVISEVLGLLAILFSFIATFAAIFRNRTYKYAAAITSFISTIFGCITFAVYFTSTWEIYGSTIGAAVKNGDIKLGYSSGFQIAGIIFSFVGSLLAAIFPKKRRGIPLLGDKQNAV